MSQIATTEPRQSINSVALTNGAHGSGLAPQSLGDVVRFAEVMCKADIALPKHLRGNAGACMAVAMQALEWQMSPFAVASKSYEVGGRIAYEAQLIAAVVNTRSGIKGRLKYHFDGEGPTLTCRVVGILDGEECEYVSPPVGSITVKNSPLWKSDTQQQLGYFSARSWARRHCPEVILGVYDREETESFQGPDNAKDVTPGLAERLAIARADTAQPASEREGFDRGFVARETGTAPAASKTEITVPSESPPSDVGRDVDDPPKGVAVENSEGELDSGNGAGAPDDSGSVGESTSDAAATPSANAADQAGEVVHVGLSDASPAEHECIKKMLDLAADKQLSDQDFQEEIEIAADRWIGALPDGRRAFVKSVYDTAKKLRKTELKREPAEKYLKGLAA